MSAEPTALARCDTGTSGLDHILRGGFPSHALYLVQGDPGVGKTTLAMQFLLAGSRRGESCLYVTFSETREELLRLRAHTHLRLHLHLHLRLHLAQLQLRHLHRHLPQHQRLATAPRFNNQSMQMDRVSSMFGAVLFR